MTSLTRKLLLPAILLTSFFSSEAQDFSNRGKDFWIGYGNHVKMYKTSGLESMSLYITSDLNTSGNVTISNLGIDLPFTVTANQITTVNIPRTARLDMEGVSKNGIHVTALNPVVVYAHIYADNISGATLCLPTSTLGREYYSINYKQVSNEEPAYSYFFAIATEDNTQVEITPAAVTLNGWQAGSVHAVTLNKGEIYQVLSKTDLTGSVIRSVGSGSGGCKKIAVYSGSGKLTIAAGSCSSNSADNTIQQVYPTNTWGKKYIAIPSSGRPFNIYRVLKSVVNANVYVDGALVPPAAFVNDLYYEFSGTGTHVVQSDEPIMLAQYFTTQNCDGNKGVNDPEMIFINPVEQTITNVTLNSTPNYDIQEHYINIAVKNAGTAISSMMLDGNSIASSFKPLPEDPLYSFAQVAVSRGKHQLVSDSGFNAIAYGFGSTESYGYSAGTNVQDLYQYVSIRNQYGTVNFPAGCDEAPFRLSAVFPYQPLTLNWQFNGLWNDTLIVHPAYDSSWVVNGRTLYEYRLQKDYAVKGAGTYPVSLIANNPTSDGCSGEQQVDYELQVYERPKAGFTSSYTGCQPDEARFTDISDGGGRQVISRLWDFGDGVLLEGEKNPAHKYALPGEYQAKLTIITDIGCLSEPMTVPVTVNPAPVAAFSFPPVVCEGREVSFTDQSSITSGSIDKWDWNLGDGTVSDQSSPVHLFPDAGIYTVSLQLESGKGCKSPLFSLPVTVHNTPEASFILPEVCLNDSYAAFTENSTIKDNSMSQFKWRWTFGDPQADPANPDQSDEQNGRHRYSQAAEYEVNLLVTSKDGCADDTTILFTVNGAVPVADFEVNEPDRLCSNLPVTITDRSTVDFGNITRVEIYWDYANNPTLKTTEEAPEKGNIYSYTYKDFGGQDTREVQILYVVYSGITCLNQQAKTITLHPSPQLKFDAMDAVCAEFPAFRITKAYENSGLQGTGVFSGEGISDPSGIFSPHLVAAGVRTVLFTYTSGAGCVSTLSQTIRVFPTPVVKTGEDQWVLQGDTVLLVAAARGDDLDYKWTPDADIKNASGLTAKVYPPDDRVYRLTARSPEGCEGKDEVLVRVLKEVKAPNAFSPNGDGINDTWQIPDLAAYQNCEVSVYDRKGQLIYRSKGYTKPWDGRLNGRPLPFGTYYWIIKPGNGRMPLNGSVTIIR